MRGHTQAYTEASPPQTNTWMTGAQKKKQDTWMTGAAQKKKHDEGTYTGLYRGIATSDEHMDDRSTEKEAGHMDDRSTEKEAG